jgi:hypothetical protein
MTSVQTWRTANGPRPVAASKKRTATEKRQIKMKEQRLVVGVDDNFIEDGGIARSVRVAAEGTQRTRFVGKKRELGAMA